MNLRRRINPPLPDTSFGNCVGLYVLKGDNADSTDLPSLATKMRDAKEEYMQGYPTKLRGPEGLSLIRGTAQQRAELVKAGFTMYWLTSWCRFGFNEADFGWGKPIWTSIYHFTGKNNVVLLDAIDGEGIEVWLTQLELA